MWSWLMRVFGFRDAVADAGADNLAASDAGQDWNGTILSGEEYR